MPDLGICSELGFLVNKCRMWEIFYWPSHRCSLQCKATERRPQPLALKPPSCAVSKRPRRSFWKWRPRLEFYVRKRVKLKIFLPTFLKNVPNARVKRSSARSESCWSELIQGEVLPMAMLECEIMVHVTHKSEDLFDIARILSRNTSTRNIEHHIFKPFPRIHILLEFEYMFPAEWGLNGSRSSTLSFFIRQSHRTGSMLQVWPPVSTEQPLLTVLIFLSYCLIQCIIEKISTASVLGHGRHWHPILIND